MPIEYLFVLFIIIGPFVWIYYANNSTEKGAPFIPLESDVIERALNLAQIKPNEKFYELGSGDGRVVVAAALKGAESIGIEIDLLRAIYSRIWINLLMLHRQSKIINCNFFEINLSDADILFMYLLPETTEKLEPKLEKELKKGTRIVSVAFEFPNWKPKKIDPRGPIYGPIYLYQI